MAGIVAQAFWAPKYADAEHEWEDGYALDARSMRFAVADGAAAGFDSRAWALALVLAFREDPPLRTAGPDAVADWLGAVAARYRSRAPSPSRDDDRDGRTEWMYTAAVAQGAFAAFLGVQFWVGGRDLLRWKADAVGDCCLLQLRVAARVAAFPLTAPEQFTLEPDLVPSSSALLAGIADRVRVTVGKARPGDIFLLASDAMSRWLLATPAADGWRQVLAARDDREFRELVDRERAAGRMERDDVALARLTVKSS